MNRVPVRYEISVFDVMRALALLLIAAVVCVAQDSEPHLFPVRQGNNYGYIDSHGVVRIPFKFQYAGEFRNGLAKAEIGDMCGYINSASEFSIAPKYDFLHSGNFSEGLASVEQERRNGYIDETGKLAILPRFFMTSEFSEGMAKVWTTPTDVGYIDKSGYLIIPDVYEDPSCNFHEGVTCVRKDGKIGFIDKEDNVAVPFIFWQAHDFSEGLAPASKGNKWGFIDHTGKVVIQFQFDLAWEFQDGLAPVQSGDKWGFINKSGQWVIAPQFGSVFEFGDGLAPARLTEKWGYIGREGAFLRASV